MLFTTSWDDGYTLDRRVSDLLTKYELTGTFYVCPKKQHGEHMLSDDQIKQMSEAHEVGAHSLRHPWLTKITDREAKTEIEESKAWVEQLTGKPCTMFCYPYGDYNNRVRELVMQAGFTAARTTQNLQFIGHDPFSLPTTLAVTPFPRRKQWKEWWHVLDPYGPLRYRFMRLRKLGIPLKAMGSWLNVTTALFDYAVESNQPFFHLWGHSRELQKYGMWSDFEKFLEYVASKKDRVTIGVNSDIVQI